MHHFGLSHLTMACDEAGERSHKNKLQLQDLIELFKHNMDAKFEGQQQNCSKAFQYCAK